VSSPVSGAFVFCPSIVLSALLTCTLSVGQDLQDPEARQADTPQSHAVKRIHPIREFEQFAAYWTEEPGWHTELQLRNNPAAGELVVTPSLRSPDGTELQLAPVTIPPGDVANVPVHESLMNSRSGFTATYGSVVFHYRAPVIKALNAVAMIHLEGKPIGFHVDAYPQASRWVTGSREGIWWLPRDTATDYLVLTNTSGKSVETTLVLRDASGRSWQEKVSFAAKQMSRLSVRSMLKRANLRGTFGGITLEIPKGAGNVDTFHVIVDEVAGSSAVMKMFDRDPKSTIDERSFGGLKQWILRAPMLALANPDPALGFPAETRLKPTVFLRNASPKPTSAQLHFTWRSDLGTGTTKPIPLLLKPYQTLVMDLASLQSQNVLPAEAHWASAFITAPGVQPDQLLAVAASYDKSGLYGSQTPFSDQLASHWEGDQWMVDETHNSIITVGNGGTKPVKARLTFRYSGGTDTYEIEQVLAPEQQMWIDVMQLAHNQVPDKNGHILPAGNVSGSYSLEELGNAGDGSLFEGKLILDRTFGETVYGCMVCCGPAGGTMDNDPLGVPVSGNFLQGITGTDSCTGLDVPMTGEYTSWWTGNTAIATTSMNNVHGVAVGSTTLFAQGTITYGDGLDRRSCPTRLSNVSNVTNVVKLSCPSSVTRGNNATCTVTGPSGTSVSNWKFSDGTNTVTTSSTSLSWSGKMATSGTVSVTATMGGRSVPLSSGITINNRTNMAFTAVNPHQLTGTNSISCYNGTDITLKSPPQPNGWEGYSCADLAYSFNSDTIQDGGPNNGYEYITSVSSASGSQVTKFEYIVVSDLLNSGSSFYTHQCGTYSSSNHSGFIAGTQLNRNAFDHETGTVLSHWTEYRDAQNDSDNNIGTVLEATTAPPGSSGSSFGQTAGDAARDRIAQAANQEPCGGFVNEDSSQSCRYCGTINFAPYQSCGTGNPVPYCN
jgi:hypothetical protein